jgi:peptidoglycan hydrolase-like protein with peptidoglycan-binding domain
VSRSKLDLPPRWGQTRRVVVVASVVVLVAGAVAGWFLLAPDNDGSSAENAPAYDLATAERRDLRVGTRVSGRWGYGAQQPIPIRRSGTVTWLPPVGEQASLGDVLVRVDDRPVVLMYGATPAYRAMDAGGQPDPVPPEPRQSESPPATGPDGGVQKQAPAPEEPEPVPPAVGPDVEQLELGLSRLGYSGFTVDEEFTDATASAVRAWQEDLGVPATGRVEFGDVVFLPGPIRLHPSPGSLGQGVSDSSVQQSGTQRLVTAEVADADWAQAGVRVEVTLPNQKTTTGKVIAVGSVGDGSEGGAGSGGMAAQRVTIRLTRDPKVGPGPVEVTYVSARADDVLTVPVTALVALAEGGYGVQVADGGYVAVEPGLYAEGLVEVGGDLEVGTKIRVPK